MELDSNCYWYTRGVDFNFAGSTFSKWQNETGHDRNSIIEDPGMINLSNGTYTLNNGIAEKIGFDLFNPGKAGVYGDADWIEKALLPESMITDFKETVSLNMK